MYADDTGFERFLRVLSASFRVGVFFGVEVRMFWLGLVITPLVYSGWIWDFPGVSFVEAAAITVLMTGGLFFLIWAHEMGHVLAGRRYRVWTSLITLSPLGGLAHLQSAAPGPKADIVISAAGPATHLLWLAVLWPLSLVLEPTRVTSYGWYFEPLSFTVEYLLYLNVAMAAFNLLPFFPMDGGRIFRSLLALRMHPNRASLIAARVGMAGAILMAMAAFTPLAGRFYGGVLFAIALNNFFACRREAMAARYSDGPYGEVREPWEGDPDAWKRGVGLGEPEEEEPLRRRWFRRRRGRAPGDEGRDAPTSAEVDRLLERVSQVGLAGLTPAERAALLKASAARKSRP
jgi:Zn-dependent protease